MYDTVEQCDSRLAEISEEAEELGARTARILARLQLEEKFLHDLRAMIHEQETSEGMSETRRTINNMSPTLDDSTLSEPNKRLVNIIRLNPGIATLEIATRVEENGQSLSNRLGDLQRQKRIENRGEKRPNGARWYVTT